MLCVCVMQGNLQSWLLNKECLDQLSVIYTKGEMTSILMNSAPEFTTVEQRAVRSNLMKLFS